MDLHVSAELLAALLAAFALQSWYIARLVSKSSGQSASEKAVESMKEAANVAAEVARATLATSKPLSAAMEQLALLVAQQAQSPAMERIAQQAIAVAGNGQHARKRPKAADRDLNDGEPGEQPGRFVDPSDL